MIEVLPVTKTTTKSLDDIKISSSQNYRLLVNNVFFIRGIIELLESSQILLSPFLVHIRQKLITNKLTFGSAF